MRANLERPATETHKIKQSLTESVGNRVVSSWSKSSYNDSVTRTIFSNIQNDSADRRARANFGVHKGRQEFACKQGDPMYPYTYTTVPIMPHTYTTGPVVYSMMFMHSKLSHLQQMTMVLKIALVVCD